MFEIYGQCEGQIFVVIDKVDKYTDSDEVPGAIAENTVLELSREHELFGVAWNRGNTQDIEEEDVEAE